MDNKSYTISSSLMLQTIDDETLLMDSKTQLFYELNESGTVLFEVIQKHHTFNDVVDEMLERYDVSKEQIELDLNTFVTYLIEQGILELHATS